MEHLSRSRPSYSSLSKEQKMAFILLAFFGVGGAIFGAVSFYSYAKRPFEIQLVNYAKDGQVFTLTQQEDKEREDQKTRDTDSDGLSDYDELYIFNTSPYVSDSDSDGKDDKTEVYEGTDPNCSDSSGCAVVVEKPPETGLITGSSGLPDPTRDLPSFSSLLGGDSLGDVGTQTQIGVNTTNIPKDLKELVDSLPIAQIREAASKSGFPQDELDKLDDESLRAVFLQTLENSAAKGELQIPTLKGEAIDSNIQPSTSSTGF